MYQIGDVVLYGTTGVCRIENKTVQTFGGIKKEYYILKPMFQQGSTVYVPKDNEELILKMRRILTAEEIYDVINNSPAKHVAWDSADNVRKQLYNEILESGDRSLLVAMFKAVFQHKEEQLQRGKKLHICDEMFLARAQRMLFDEIMLVLNIQKEDVLPMILGTANAAQ